MVKILFLSSSNVNDTTIKLAKSIQAQVRNPYYAGDPELVESVLGDVPENYGPLISEGKVKLEDIQTTAKSVGIKLTYSPAGSLKTSAGEKLPPEPDVTINTEDGIINLTSKTIKELDELAAEYGYVYSEGEDKNKSTRIAAIKAFFDSEE